MLCMASSTEPVDRDAIGVEHFQGWIDWGRSQGVNLDFNPSYFSHEKASDGFTLSHADKGIREFWIDHGIACRKIAAAMGSARATLRDNFWMPDGYKDTPADRKSPRERLAASLDEIFASNWLPAHTLMPWNASCSELVAKATWSVRTSSIWATRSRGTKCCASMPVTFIPPK